jgi:glycosyltransferase involved in cell wall biosynthesis
MLPGEPVRILFLYDNPSTFVRQDLSILESEFEVDARQVSPRFTSREVVGALRRTHLSFSWFALGYAARAVLWGRVLGRPSIVVSGGWDVLSMPGIGYGAIGSRRTNLRARVALRYATLPLTFSAWSRDTIRRLVGREPELLYLGVDVESYRPSASKDDLVVTVGNVTRQNLARKGLEIFARAAALVPEARFVLVGRHADDGVNFLRAIAPPNLELPGWLTEKDLRDVLARATVYVQASYTEGFGLALAEAMASGCVPVVTGAGAIPEVVGDVGYYVPFGDVERTAVAIREALASNRGPSARQRVVNRFPLDLRRKRLLALVHGVLGERTRA